jgi:hypothetical protein
MQAGQAYLNFINILFLIQIAILFSMSVLRLEEMDAARWIMEQTLRVCMGK